MMSGRPTARSCTPRAFASTARSLLPLRWSDRRLAGCDPKERPEVAGRKCDSGSCWGDATRMPRQTDAVGAEVEHRPSESRVLPTEAARAAQARGRSAIGGSLDVPWMSRAAVYARISSDHGSLLLRRSGTAFTSSSGRRISHQRACLRPGEQANPLPSPRTTRLLIRIASSGSCRAGGTG